ncbi:MAG: PPC domain-containing protein, partial [Chthoniobacteraceae bacterium]
MNVIGPIIAATGAALRMTMVFLFASQAVAQLPFARIDSVYPPSGQIGTEIEVTLTGPELVESTALLFDTDKITATKIEAKKFRVTLGADCPPGLHDVRAIGPTGISTPAIFVAGDTPEALDSADNHSRAKAQDITPPCAVAGVFDSETLDIYRFPAQAGQALAITCLAQLIDSPANPTIVVRDPAGREIARALNTHDRDAALEFTPAADGAYFVEVFDHLFAGSPQHIYRLSVADASRSNYPLPRAPASSTIPDQEGLPMITESEPNDTFAQAQRISLPCAISGTQLDHDWFEFQ